MRFCVVIIICALVVLFVDPPDPDAPVAAAMPANDAPSRAPLEHPLFTWRHQVAIGSNAIVLHTNVILIGHGLTSTTNNQLRVRLTDGRVVDYPLPGVIDLGL